MTALGDLTARAREDLGTIGASLPLRLLVLVVALVANIGFYLPRVPLSGGVDVPGSDKVVHVLVFALTVWAAGRVVAPLARFPIGWVVLVALAHAVVIELVQGAVLAERSAQLGDVVADAIGIALGVIAWRVEQLRTAVPVPETREAR